MRHMRFPSRISDLFRRAKDILVQLAINSRTVKKIGFAFFRLDAASKIFRQDLFFLTEFYYYDQDNTWFE